MKTTVRVTRDEVQNIIANIEAMTGKRVLIGIPGENAGRKDGPISNAALGYIHENVCRISRPLDVELNLKLRFATYQTKRATLKGLYELAAFGT